MSISSALRAPCLYPELLASMYALSNALCQHSHVACTASFDFASTWLFDGPLNTWSPKAPGTVTLFILQQEKVISQNRGTSIETPKCYRPFYRDPQTGTPNLARSPKREVGHPSNKPAQQNEGSTGSQKRHIKLETCLITDLRK